MSSHEKELFHQNMPIHLKTEQWRMVIVHAEILR